MGAGGYECILSEPIDGKPKETGNSTQCNTLAPQNCDVYLIDDIFASLDAHVAAHVLEHAVCGLLAGKTRLLVGHYLPAVQRAAILVTMRGGTFAYLGPPQEGLDSISDELRGVCTG